MKQTRKEEKAILEKIQSIEIRQPKNKREKRRYANALMAFDIETTRLEDDNSIMYIWQCALLIGNEIYVQYGRTWEAWKEVCDSLNAHLGDECKIVCYVHNLSYEFQFLAGVQEFDDVKCLQERKILTAVTGSVEYRCSYIWTNRPLAKFLADMEVEHRKQSGADFDYSKKRYPWSDLTEEEIEYCQNDVVGLLEAVDKKMQLDGDDVYTAPRTSTGYVRRDAKKALKEYDIGGIKPTVDIYRKLRQAFRGGNTHANRYYVGKVMSGVESVDRSSSYPDVMLNQRFPMTQFHKEVDGYSTIKRLMQLDSAILCTLTISGACLRDETFGCPYIPTAKCIMLHDVVEDNGRVLSAGLLAIVCTDVDLRIIIDEYDGDYDFTDIYSADKDYLPEKFREVVRDYYRKKTALKGVKGEEYQYGLSKALLNSLYGMCATDPGKDNIVFFEGEYITEKADVAKNIKKSFLPYQWGVWVTAYARAELEEMIKTAGRNFVYADTDSCKFLKNESIKFDDYNERCKGNSLENGACSSDPKGKMHYMGVAEYEGEYYHFITWGAKKYASEDENGKISITIAGVHKRSEVNSKGEIITWGGADELMENGGLESFRDGFVFVKSGGLESVYNDDADYYVEIDGHKLHVSRNVCLRPSTYTLGITQKYRDIIESIENTYISVDAERYMCYNLFRR